MHTNQTPTHVYYNWWSIKYNTKSGIEDIHSTYNN